jgi:tRNA G37 N-methylase Trm5
MFSRGNVTEKQRFASMVREGERVLDMYAGIGYYTLPALVHGKAGHVTACEWNPHAVYALRYNLKANGVEHRATVLEGDCRVSLKAYFNSQEDDENAQHKYFDRVSLGLLPSSEGGWAVAIASLNPIRGGWLHIHGNVAAAERQQWCHWVCQCLQHLAESNNSKEWQAVCTHVEKVKSFAPMVDHVVADVFVGPSDLVKMKSAVMDFDATTDVSPPSCALSKDGILHQDWLIS